MKASLQICPSGGGPDLASRPIFAPILAGQQLVRVTSLDFSWHAGMSVRQRRLNIRSLHEAAAAAGLSAVLEVSTKSEEVLGRELSAFNLTTALADGRVVPVEVAFQAGKEFERGGPFPDLLTVNPWEAKRDPRLMTSGRLRFFRFGSDVWALEPQTAFYDWLYLRGLSKRVDLCEKIARYVGFTDIEFNPKRSISCQARSVALFLALSARGLVETAVEGRESFLTVLARFDPITAAQRTLSDEPAPPR